MMTSKSKSKRRFFITGLLFALILVVFVGTYIYFLIGPSFACLFSENGSARQGISSRILVSSEVQRCYLLYVPVGYDSSEPMPVVFVLHGFAGNANSLREIAVWETVAEEENFLVVYLDGSSFPLRWNIGPEANIPAIDDVQLIRDVIADLSGIATIDNGRIYVTGFSNGGQMTHRIACQLADQITAIGIVEGYDPGMLDECNPSRPVPVIAFYGTADTVAFAEYPKWFLKLVNVSTEFTASSSSSDTEIWQENWAKRNGCSSFESTRLMGSVRRIRYVECKNDADVVLYWIEGQGHAWPGGPPIPFIGESTSEINASERMWEFFQQYTLSGKP